ncbi:MAG TPA: endolytic transglycosylase MltG, partial [Acidimicrobiales bacterium]|nr:endolytic transglycosylase MltG [Acidimicrobiales bacterium]
MSEVFEPMREPGGGWARRIVIGVVVLVVLGLVAGGGALLYVRSQVDPSGPAGPEVAVEVPMGSSTQRIATILEEKGVVDNARNFRLYVRVKNAGPFQAGSYTLRENSAFDDVIAALEEGPELSFQRLTVPEGLTVKQVADLVGKMPGRSAERFLEAANSGTVRSRYQPAGSDNLEGFLFPETYNFEEKDDEKAIVQRMVSTFDQVAGEVGLDAVTQGGIVDPYQAVIVASLVEREVRLPEERSKVSRVIYNRLEKKMLLQVDATVIYALGRTGERGLRVLFKDLEVDSPYNTYKNPGLPPTPIASPGRAALEAAVSPEDGPWLYYVVIDAQGRQAFATTLAEHNRNIAAAAAAMFRLCSASVVAKACRPWASITT